MLHAITRASERWGLELTMEALEAINRTFSSKNFVPGAHQERSTSHRLLSLL
jgi:hypothetical protein